MKQKLLLFVLILVPQLASADAVEIDGIFYNLIPKAKVAEVTKKSSGYYKGNVVIPESVTYENVEYNVSTIGKSAFSASSSLTSVTIPNSVTSIAESAFSGCKSLPSVTIPSSVTSIGTSAFSGCSGLTSVTIPNSVTTIGAQAFSSCNHLIAVHITDLEAWCNIVIDDYFANPLYYAHHLYLNGEEINNLIIPNSITSIGKNAFYGCKSLTSVTIPNSVTTIAEYAFGDCNDITAVTIPNSVTSIGKYAFQKCSSLTSVTIPNSVESIGVYAFSDCIGLSSVIISNSVPTIQYGTFYNCSALVSVTIPNSVTTIQGDFYEKGAFESCTSLTSVSLGNTLESIGQRAFLSCTSLTSIDFPTSVIRIGNYAFDNCSGLTFVTIPNSVKSIGNCAFYKCTSLTSVTIPNSVTRIEGMTFGRCTGLTSVIIPNSVVYIAGGLNERGAFNGCSGLKSITIPNSVEIIGEYAFAGCSSLTSVIIGSGIKSISFDVFSNCSELTDVYCYAETVPSTSSNAFKNSYIEYATLHVPAKSIDAYKATLPWSNFKEIVAIVVPEHTLTYTVDGTAYKTYTIEEGETVTPEAEPSKEGYTFSGWSEIPSTMPDHDVMVKGTFTINKYKLTYKVDGANYKTYDVEFNSAITPEEAPAKDGYTFSGWSEIPETMPASDVTITGTFTINKYKLTYTVDGEEYKASDVEYGTKITPEAAPTKEGYTFSGWSEIPETMPANDVTISGTFTINKYTITYIIDGEVFKSMEVEYNSAITPPDAPAQEGYDFAWADVPETMPASDITIYGTYTTGISSLNVEEKDKQVFSPDGKRVETPQKGLNIIRMNDGTVKKVVVK